MERLRSYRYEDFVNDLSCNPVNSQAVEACLKNSKTRGSLYRALIKCVI